MNKNYVAPAYQIGKENKTDIIRTSGDVQVAHTYTLPEKSVNVQISASVIFN